MTAEVSVNMSLLHQSRFKKHYGGQAVHLYYYDELMQILMVGDEIPLLEMNNFQLIWYSMTLRDVLMQI